MYAGQSCSVFEGILHYHYETLIVDSVFAKPAVTFSLCHVIVELLAVGSSLLLVRRRGTLYLTIYVINAKNFHGSLTTVVRAQNDTPKTANITCTIFDRTLL